VLTGITQFTDLVGLPMKPDIFFLISLLFNIRTHGLFFSTFYRVTTISNNCFFFS
jgi:hypothetical protein